jgi:hypothetical protein
MTKRSIVPLTILAACLGARPARAADHLDGPAVKADPSTDITDLYAWMSPDAAHLYLVMDVYPLADKANSRFSNVAKYAFHLHSAAQYGGTVKGMEDLICTFDVSQHISCWLVDKFHSDAVLDYVHGDASQPSGLLSTDGRMKVFSGPRDDPFFFNLQGFKDAATFVAVNKGSLMFDMYGCPKLDKATSGLAISVLSHTNNGTAPPADFFQGKNVLSIVVSVDKTLVSDANDPIVGVWASTNK